MATLEEKEKSVLSVLPDLWEKKERLVLLASLVPQEKRDITASLDPKELQDQKETRATLVFRVQWVATVFPAQEVCLGFRGRLVAQVKMEIRATPELPAKKVLKASRVMRDHLDQSGQSDYVENLGLQARSVSQGHLEDQAQEALRVKRGQLDHLDLPVLPESKAYQDLQVTRALRVTMASSARPDLLVNLVNLVP